jgi:hypothetical protein
MSIVTRGLGSNLIVTRGYGVRRRIVEVLGRPMKVIIDSIESLLKITITTEKKEE